MSKELWLSGIAYYSTHSANFDFVVALIDGDFVTSDTINQARAQAMLRTGADKIVITNFIPLPVSANGSGK